MPRFDSYKDKLKKLKEVGVSADESEVGFPVNSENVEKFNGYLEDAEMYLGKVKSLEGVVPQAVLDFFGVKEGDQDKFRLALSKACDYVENYNDKVAPVLSSAAEDNIITPIEAIQIGEEVSDLVQEQVS